jgi:hypothetical protein
MTTRCVIVKYRWHNLQYAAWIPAPYFAEAKPLRLRFGRAMSGLGLESRTCAIVNGTPVVENAAHAGALPEKCCTSFVNSGNPTAGKSKFRVPAFAGRTDARIDDPDTASVEPRRSGSAPHFRLN